MNHAQSALRDDATVLHKILKDLIVIKDTTSGVKEAVQRINHEEEVRKVVASSTRLAIL